METVNGKALRLKAADYLALVASGTPLEVTYKQRPSESVALIPPALWRAGIGKSPVPESKIREAGVRELRDGFGGLRVDAVLRGTHVRITNNGAEHVVLVPIDWARWVVSLPAEEGATAGDSEP